MRNVLIAAALLLAAACYRDNASPFVHGPRNDPSKGTGSRGALASSESEPGSTATAAAPASR